MCEKRLSERITAPHVIDYKICLPFHLAKWIFMQMLQRKKKETVDQSDHFDAAWINKKAFSYCNMP